MKIDAYENISNEELGAKIRRNHQKHLEKVQANSEVWEKEGEEYRDVRETLRITQKEISENIGVCVAVVSKFEHGEYVRSRNMLTHAYKLAVKKIQNDRNAILKGEK